MEQPKVYFPSGHLYAMHEQNTEQNVTVAYNGYIRKDDFDVYENALRHVLGVTVNTEHLEQELNAARERLKK